MTVLKVPGGLVFGSEEAVHAFDRFGAVVHALGADALAAGVVEPAVLGAAHGLAVLLTLTDRHAVIEVDHRAHALLSVVVGMDAVAGQRHVLVLVFERL